MTSKFSVGLIVSDLNDYITPAQECVKPVKLDTTSKAGIKAIEIDSESNYFQVNKDGTRTQLKKTKIELSDCLACSGCITSAESVLVNQQSVKEFLEQLKTVQATAAVLAISVSPQSRASLAAAYGIASPTECMQKIVSFCTKYLGAQHVFDTSFSRNVSLLEMCHEFVAKYKQERSDNMQPIVEHSILESAPKKRKQQNKNEILPLLASSCPGWVCYAEKTQGSDILPFISTTKSPQAVMGTLVKQYLPNMHTKGKTVYHVSVMPCFDKKLEASRADFVIENNTKEVDMVLTTTELKELIEHFKVDFASLPLATIDPLFNDLSNSNTVAGVPGGSGGYLETVFRFAAKTLFNTSITNIEYKKGRNEDFQECKLEIQGKTVLTFAKCYGFRNIQTLMRKLKNKTCEYDLVEIMACPGGCLNGGGQIKPQASTQAKEFLKTVDAVYHNVAASQVTQHEQVQNLYSSWINGDPYSLQAKSKFHTQYHAVEKININPLTIQW